MKPFSLVLLLGLLGFASCVNRKEQLAFSPKPQPVFLVDTSLILHEKYGMPKSLKYLYTKSKFAYVWLDSMKISDAGDTLISILQNAEILGLTSVDYYAGDLADILRDTTPSGMMQAELFLSDRYFQLRDHLQYGRLDSKTLLKRKQSEVVDSVGVDLLLNETLPISQAIQIAEPAILGYASIKDSLKILLATVDRNPVAETKMQQCIIAMEKIRWRQKLPSRYISVNIPAYELSVIEKDSPVLTSSVVVGKPDSKTPRLESVVRSFVIYPYWHVPRSIAVNELLPLIQKDSTYLTKHRYEVLDKHNVVQNPDSIDWQSLHKNNFPFVLRQRDGHENALGIIKFVFKNPYDVFLHDTNSKRHFSKKRRALSHGCVRVEKAVELARYLVKDDSIYITPDDLGQYLNLRQRYTIKVLKPIPIIIDYRTCDYTNGKVRFYEDIYGLDSLIYAAFKPNADSLPGEPLMHLNVLAANE